MIGRARVRVRSATRRTLLRNAGQLIAPHDDAYNDNDQLMAQALLRAN